MLSSATQATKSSPNSPAAPASATTQSTGRAGLRGLDFAQQTAALTPPAEKTGASAGGEGRSALAAGSVPANKKKLAGLAGRKLSKILPVSMENAIGLSLGGYRIFASFGFERAANFASVMANPAVVDAPDEGPNSLVYWLSFFMTHIRCEARRIYGESGRAPTKAELESGAWADMRSAFQISMGHTVRLESYGAIWDPTMLGFLGEDEWGESDL